MKKILIITATVAVAVLLCGIARHKPTLVGYEYDTAETLWGLADKYCPENMDKRQYIAEVMELNCMPNEVVHPHMLYQVPIYEKR